MLYDQDRHLSINEVLWQEDKVKSDITNIINSCISQFNDKSFWQNDKDFKDDREVTETLYMGAIGTLWGLIYCADFLEIKLPYKFKEFSDQIHKSYLGNSEIEKNRASYFLGESSILLFKLKYHSHQEDADRLYDLIKKNITNPTLETLWGAPGTMLCAFQYYQQSQDERFVQLIIDSAKFLITSLKEFNENGDKIWIQDLYGKKVSYVGAGHGYFGNMYPLLKCRNYLSKEDQEFILEHVTQITKELAFEEDNLVNWPSTLKSQRNKLLVQWCHGAAGIINCLIDYPKDHDSKVEELLIKAGELIWRAGALKKGVGLCHGTDGNGIALLQLYKRTGNELWLERARAFGMHAMTQKQGNYSLYTGDIGLGVYLVNCIKRDERFPTLDVF